ncbi:glycoside hydrolase family 28 protein [Favolaschia claudopus]|uniref:endo-polygalacturonase n=1 Tax=Favolaschia claudopus TaxID=2862362 RepID=A0AAW0EDG5_9AGAR
MPTLTSLLQLAALAVVAVSLPTDNSTILASRTETAKRATCTVSSVASAANLSGCSAVVITAFTVPSGQTLTIAAASGATVTMTGDLTFAKTTSAGPLITFDTKNIVFNGGNHKINGNGAMYWDGQGTNGGVTKPHPFVKYAGLIKFKGFGTFQSVTVLNSPAHAISVGTSGGSTTIQGITVDNSAGDSGALGHNTDGFDISASSVTVSKCVVKNQDDCVAINSGSSIAIQDLTCSGGHGISIGSIATGKTVSGVKISRNTITNSMYGLRIKVNADATNAGVSNIVYEANTISGIAKYGVLISQSYPSDNGTPGTGAPITAPIAFTGGTTNVAVSSSAHTLAIDCGACSGTWDFSGLHATGGVGHSIVANKAVISGGTY